MDEKKKKLVVVVILACVFLVVFIGTRLTQDGPKTKHEASEEKADKKLEKLLRDIECTNVDPVKGNIADVTYSLADELPDIQTNQPVVVGDGEINLEIFSSSEKSGKVGQLGWLSEIAQEFNNSGMKINGKTCSITVRTVDSGLASDYIASGKYLPDCFTPSNELFGEMTIANGGTLTLEKQRLVGNVAGILFKSKKKEEIEQNHGALSMKAITEATINNEIAMGYTNPQYSATGLNFLLSALNCFDPGKVLSNKAEEQFVAFQKNIPFIASTTTQMDSAVVSGALDGMIIEYQTYVSTPNYKNNYEFTPFGARHDNPLYSVGKLSKNKKKLLKEFLKVLESEESQKRATEVGFNGLDSYVSEDPVFDGDTIARAQQIWKDKKNAGGSVTAVFVTDISGSMDQEVVDANGDYTGKSALDVLKSALVNATKYISDQNSIGLISYSSKVFINLPIEKFDINQKSMFIGSVQNLQANGNTASYDAVAVALDMLNEKIEADPTTKPMLFLLTDGQTNTGCKLSEVKPLVEAYGIPVYCISYNEEVSALAELSSVNEAEYISSDSDDIIYKIKKLFNSQM